MRIARRLRRPLRVRLNPFSSPLPNSTTIPYPRVRVTFDVAVDHRGDTVDMRLDELEQILGHAGAVAGAVVERLAEFRDQRISEDATLAA